VSLQICMAIKFLQLSIADTLVVVSLYFPDPQWLVMAVDVIGSHDCIPMQCVRYLSKRTLFKQLREDRFKIAAVGCGCSLATEPAAEVSHFFNIPQVNF